MKVIPWLKAACIDFLILNLFLTIVSLPILVAWGLPLSWLSPLGNLIFSPFLSIFLLMSTLAFFCEIMHIPHAALDYLLEKITLLWQTLLHLAPANSLVGCSYAAFYLLSLLSVATMILLMLPQLRAARLRLGTLSMLFLCTLTILKAAQPAQLTTTLSCLKKEMELIRNENQTVLIDRGALCERANPASWVQYHLVPDLIRATGSMRIDHLIIPRPTIRALEAAAALMQHANVQHLYYPTIEGEMSGSHRFAFRKFYAIGKGKGISLIRVSRERRLCIGSQTLQIALGANIKYRDVSYHPLAVH